MLKFSGFPDLTSCRGGLPRQNRSSYAEDPLRIAKCLKKTHPAFLWVFPIEKLSASTDSVVLRLKDAPPTPRGIQAHDKVKALKQACFQAYPESAVCVQSPVGSRNSAIYNVYHTSLRPSSLFEPRHPSLKVVKLSTTTRVVGVCKMMIEFSRARCELPVRGNRVNRSGPGDPHCLAVGR